MRGTLYGKLPWKDFEMSPYIEGFFNTGCLMCRRTLTTFTINNWTDMPKQTVQVSLFRVCTVCHSDSTVSKFRHITS